jgi:hypothetical protein
MARIAIFRAGAVCSQAKLLDAAYFNQEQPDRMSGGEVFTYVRHRQEQTLLYQLIQRHWPEFQAHLSEVGSYLPRHVTREFDEYLDCGMLERGFLRVRYKDCPHSHHPGL